MKRGPLPWVNQTRDRFLIGELNHGGFNVVPVFLNEQKNVTAEFFKTRSEAIYWRDKFSAIFKIGFVAGMEFQRKTPDKNQIDLFQESR